MKVRSGVSKSPPYPFIKWAGGKQRVLPHILRRMPSKIGTYYEPMLGGGAVFIELARQKRFDKAVLSDMNPDLMNTWRIVKSDAEALIEELSSPAYVYDRQAYETIRSQEWPKEFAVRRAARFIYLNRTCFNGLYRVNRGGKFNVPFGRYENPLICDKANLKAISELLQNVTLLEEDFETSVLGCGPGDASYFDPPYVPVSKTSNFTSYTEGGFSLDDHRRLADVMSKLGASGARVVASNSAADAAVEIFSRFDIDKLESRRNIGGPAAYRKSVEEIVAFVGPKF